MHPVTWATRCDIYPGVIFLAREEGALSAFDRVAGCLPSVSVCLFFSCFIYFFCPLTLSQPGTRQIVCVCNGSVRYDKCTRARPVLGLRWRLPPPPRGRQQAVQLGSDGCDYEGPVGRRFSSRLTPSRGWDTSQESECSSRPMW